MRSRVAILLSMLAGAGILYLLSRSERGQVFVGDAIEDVIVSAERIKNALWLRGWRNNNPGNIRFITGNPWDGQVANDGGYGVYDSIQQGVRAAGKQLLKYERAGLNTVEKIISTWAPKNENDTAAYAARVARDLGVDKRQVIAVSVRLEALADAMFLHENSNQYPYARADVHAWLRLA